MVNLGGRKLKLDYRDSVSSSEEGGPENFKELIAQIKSNKWSGSNKKSGFKPGFIKQLEALTENQVGWLQTAANFVKKDEKKAVHLSFKDLWSVTNKNAFLEDAILDALLCHYLKNVGYIETSIFKSCECENFCEEIPTPFENDKDAYVAVKNINNVYWISYILEFKKQDFVRRRSNANGIVEGSDEILKAFKRVHHNELNKEDVKCSKWDFRNNDRKIDYTDHELQKDIGTAGLVA